MNKTEIYLKLAELVTRTRSLRGVAGNSRVKVEMDEIDKKLQLLEDVLSKDIDNFMAAKYRTYIERKNRKHRDSGKRIGEGLGVWYNKVSTPSIQPPLS